MSNDSMFNKWLSGYSPDLPIVLADELRKAWDHQQKEIDRLRDSFEELHDRLENGIKYDEENNQYILVWTQREIDRAKEEADKFVKFFKELPKDED